MGTCTKALSTAIVCSYYNTWLYLQVSDQQSLYKSRLLDTLHQRLMNEKVTNVSQQSLIQKIQGRFQKKIRVQK